MKKKRYNFEKEQMQTIVATTKAIVEGTKPPCDKAVGFIEDELEMGDELREKPRKKGERSPEIQIAEKVISRKVNRTINKILDWF